MAEYVERVSDVMTRDLVRVDAMLDVSSLARLFARERLPAAAVMEAGTVGGVITARALAAFLEGRTVPRTRRTGFLDDDDGFFRGPWDPANSLILPALLNSGALTGPVATADVMSRYRLAIGPDATVAEASRWMGRLGARRLLVMSHGDLLGLVTAEDVRLRDRLTFDRPVRYGHATR